MTQYRHHLHTSLRRRWWLVVLLLLAGCGGQGGQGLIMYRVFGDDKRPKPQLVVTDFGSKPLRQIALPNVLQDGIATPLSHKALVRTDDEQVLLVDAGKGTAQALQFEPEDQGQVTLRAPQFVDSGSTHWTLLGTPSLQTAYLVNLETGATTNLAKLDDAAGVITFGQFSSDERMLRVMIGEHLWLVPTANPSDARQISTDQVVFGGSFSSDSKQFVYSRQTAAKAYEVVLEPVDGGAAQVVATSDNALLTPVFVPGQRQLLLTYPDKLTTLSLDNRTETPLLQFNGEQRGPLRFTLDGRKVLFSYGSEDVREWRLLDLKQNTAQPLDTLKGMYMLAGSPKQRWLVFADALNPSQNQRLTGLDLQTGATQQVLALNDQPLFFQIVGLSFDGKYGLAQVLQQNKTQLWLFSNAGGAARLLSEGDSVGGTFAPDGRWVAVSTLTGGKESTAKLVLMATDSPTIKLLGEGFAATWLRP